MNDNTTTHGDNRAPRSPAMSTTSSYSTYSNNQFNVSINSSHTNGNSNNSSKRYNNGNGNNNNNAGGNTDNNGNTNINSSSSKNNTLLPSLPSSINPLSVNSWVETSAAVADEKKDDDDDDVIPTAIVIKNIPFSIKKEQLLDEMTRLSLPLPYAFNYHFDNGVFRGLAFANFTSTEETAMVVNNLNGKEIGGRKLRVEYKKMLPLVERERIEREKREKRGQLEEQHRSGSTTSLNSLANSKLPNFVGSSSGLSATNTNNGSILSTNNTGNSVNTAVGTGNTENLFEKRYFAVLPNVNSLPVPSQPIDFNNPEVLDMYSTLLLFKSDVHKKFEEIVYPLSIANNYKKNLTILCNFLNLQESYENGYIVIKRRSTGAALLMHTNMNSSHGNIAVAAQRYRSTPTHQPQPRAAAQNYGLLNDGSSGNNSTGNSGNNGKKKNNNNNNVSNNVSTPVTPNSNAIRGTRSYADVRATPFLNTNVNGTVVPNTGNVTSPTYLNISQPPTPGMDVNNRFAPPMSKSPYIHSNSSGTLLSGMPNPPTHSLYSHYNNSNPSFRNNSPLISLAQNLTGGDSYTSGAFEENPGFGMNALSKSSTGSPTVSKTLLGNLGDGLGSLSLGANGGSGSNRRDIWKS